MMRCTDTPISWWSLELFHLKELPLAEMERVDKHLADCPLCRDCLDIIERDFRTIPQAILAPEVDSLWQRVRRPLVYMTATAVVALTMVLVAWWNFPNPRLNDFPREARIHYKGGELSLTVVRERDGVVTEQPEGYLAGDRFRILITAPRDLDTYYELVVFQGDNVYFPYNANPELKGGNRMPLPGAFGIDGTEPAIICLMVGDHLPKRHIVRRLGSEALPEGTVCVSLAAGEDQ